MFSTTLRLEADLGDWLRLAAEQRALSINAFLAELVRRERVLATRRRLAADWAAFAQDPEAQDVDYAFQAQADLVAEAKAPGRAPGRASAAAKPAKKARSRSGR